MPTDPPTLAGRDCRTWIGAAVHVFQTDLFTAAIFRTNATRRSEVRSARGVSPRMKVMKSPVICHDRARVRRASAGAYCSRSSAQPAAMRSKLGVSVSALLIMGALVFRQEVLEAVHNISASLTT